MQDQLITFGIVFVILGIAALTAGLVLKGLSGEKDAKVEGGAVIFIGPIPIVLGTNAKYAFLVSLIALLLMLFFFVFRQRFSI